MFVWPGARGGVLVGNAMVVPALLRPRQREPCAVQRRQREQAEAAGEGHAIS